MPPSRIGKGMRLRMPNCRLISLASPNFDIQSLVSAASPATWAMPTGPMSWLTESRCVNSRSSTSATIMELFLKKTPDFFQAAKNGRG